jgi:hypothetical protein
MNGPDHPIPKEERTVTDEKSLDRVRKLLAKAEAEGVTPEEAIALTEKAAELMAKYGIDQALLAATRPETDRPVNKIFDVPIPWARVHSHLLSNLASGLRCQAILLPTRDGQRVHIFGYASDVERLEVLYTSVLLQMTHHLVRVAVPAQFTGRRKMAWRRSWLLGYVSAVVAKVKAAEASAVRESDRNDEAPAGTSTALVLADRSLAVQADVRLAYPRTRTIRTTYTGGGYGSGYRHGQQANIGGSSVGRRSAGALTG